MHEYWQAIRTFSPSLRRFILSSALVTTVAFGLWAVLQNLFLLRLGYDARFIGLVLGFGQLAWAVAALPAGMVSSRIGLRNGYMLGPGLFAAGIALTLLVEGLPPALWPAWIIGSQVVVTTGIAFMTVNIAPYLMAVTGEAERRHAFAIFQAAIPATAFLGSVIAGLLPGFFAAQMGLSLEMAGPYRLALWLGPILCVLSIVPLFGADPAKIVIVAETAASREPAPLYLLLFYGAVIFFQAVGEGAARSFFNVYLDAGLGVPPAQIGAVMGAAQLLPIAVALTLPLILKKLGTGYTLVSAILGVSVCLLPLAAGTALWFAAASYMGIIAMTTLTGASRDLLGQELVTPRWRTTIQSVVIIGLALGWAAIGFVGGWLIDAVGFGAMWLAGIVCALIAASMLATFLRARRSGEPAAQPQAPVA